MSRICSADGCDRSAKGRYCGAHATRLRTKGSLGTDPIRRKVPAGTPPKERIDLIGWTETDSGCWEWNGRIDKWGYGLLDDLRAVPVFAHRIAHEKWIGPIPDGLVVTHSCDNPPCINPAHLSADTQLANIHDMMRKGRENFAGRKAS